MSTCLVKTVRTATVPVLDEQWQRAIDVQRSPARISGHRPVGLSDLPVAAVAERHGITVLHYDSDYDTISELTEAQARWVAVPGEIA